MPYSSLIKTSTPREARLFRNNKSQAVRIPVDFELPGKSVLIHKDGDCLIIEPLAHKGLSAALANLQPLLPEDYFPEINTTSQPLSEIEL
ncbi:antitoxin [Aristophania vespae]|uniref:antitoxin n=1 Tax=Aristophania vespae TaxID=2697033 RepID=UPI001F3764D7|nr:antitoxin [Aristophania vespae]UMM63808.1 hypothetical protein DM15PD_07850 [Aristophania vespae]